MNSFYTEDELKELGLKKYGKNVLISKKASFYGIQNISIGNNVRIDDFCLLTGDITIGNYVHISAYSALYGSFGIIINDFCGVSPHSILLSATDDFSGDYMISPIVSSKYTNIMGGKIILEKFVQIGTHSTVMPNVTCKEGSVCGAYTFINNDLATWTIYAGVPAKKLKNRNKNIIRLSKKIERL